MSKIVSGRSLVFVSRPLAAVLVYGVRLFEEAGGFEYADSCVIYLLGSGHSLYFYLLLRSHY